MLLVKSRIQVSNESFAPVVPSMKFSYLVMFLSQFMHSSQKYAVNSTPDAEVLHGEWKSGSLLGIQCWRKVTQVQKMLLFFPDYNHLVENTKSGFQRNHYYIIQKCYPLAYMALLSFLKFWYRKCSPL